MLVIGLAIVAVGSWHWWPGWPESAAEQNSTLRSPAVPEISLVNLDPSATDLISGARQRVVQAPDSAATWGRLGMLLNAYEFPGDAAAVCFTEAERLDGSDPRWPYFLGVARSNTQPAEAIADLKRAIKKLKGPAVARRRLAEMLLSQDRLSDAQRTLEPVLSDEKNSRSLVLAARIALRDKRPADAKRLAQQAAADPRSRKSALTVLSQAQLGLGETEESRTSAAQAAELPDDPPFPDPLLEQIGALRTGLRAGLARADQFMAQDRADEAIRSISETLKEYPKSDWAWLLLGRAHLQREDLDQAEEAFRKSIAIKGTSVEPLYYLATVYLLRGKYSEAADWYRRALEHKPDFAMARFNLGHCLWRLGDRPAAVDQFRQTIAAKPNHVNAHVDLAEALVEEGSVTEAVEELKIALRLEPGNEKAKSLLRQMEVRD
jgi:tetratricopeptide (TPR) repeat protein